MYRRAVVYRPWLLGNLGGLFIALKQGVHGVDIPFPPEAHGCGPRKLCETATEVNLIEIYWSPFVSLFRDF
jgi:hypothetical protein